ncbi:2-C-methyl-D-erythritol 4-phosphate cytidylyltransferase [Candidatus Blochmanniella vafra str. BVAF]|uniref:2-C-methyl-D-erythritol 4-phosphate cytidylyltransferase n=1 Tax=Blochmanniella vafra (strain BVAF) TaxID=859654 RepID=E8Q5S7_BLOVB|nr:2-C-methyl-D-erythritol 4-phosphate cytidylyltransferase [Candidatus Blochmannia vafer]ADV33574.1 2-C-methyl-D-erythritol 4-phosphate cytidylyltransferase [Candidatus Blochmannia vafer str. BVAF]
MYLDHNNFPDMTAILPAAGIGGRMHSFPPKQYCIIGNKTLIEYSINVLLQQSNIKHCIVVINCNDNWFSKLSVSYDPRVSVVIGGKTRADSVMAGLKHVKKSMWVIIHDAVRPCLHYQDLLRLFKITQFSKIGGILATPVVNTVKKAYVGSNFISHTVSRNDLWHSLTPQLFNYNLLKKCLEKALINQIIISDEASAIEYCGYTSILVRGRSDNIKITYKDDLRLAKFYLSEIYRNKNIFKI